MITRNELENLQRAQKALTVRTEEEVDHLALLDPMIAAVIGSIQDPARISTTTIHLHDQNRNHREKRNQQRKSHTT